MANPAETHLLVVEDNTLVGLNLKDMLQAEGYHVSLVHDGEAARETVRQQYVSIALVDLKLPDTNGQTLLQEWMDSAAGMLTIIMTAYGDIQTAVECIKQGAYDFLTKPVEKVLLKKTIANAVEKLELDRKVNALTELTQREASVESLGDVVATGSGMGEVMRLIRLIAQNDFSCLLIRGESGTGKGLVAKTVHQIGQRADKPFVEVNCSALPSNLVESELFGHKKGSFTDAKTDKAGLFELADGGTLFLDEIGDMDANLQAKLLKVIEDQTLRRIGDTVDIHVDVSIIAATNQNIEQLVRDGTFREDLFYRLNVVPISLPPLRDHPEDIPELCSKFVDEFAKKFGKTIRGFTAEAMDKVQRYPWPGNVRELRNVVERGCLLAQDADISSDLLLFPHHTAMHAPPAADSASQPTGEEPGQAHPTAAAVDTGNGEVLSLRETEKQTIQRAMEKAQGNKNYAARLLGIHRTTLYKKLTEYGLEEAPA